MGALAIKRLSRHEILAAEMRDHLEARGSDLGVPFSSETLTGDLALLVVSEEQRDIRRMQTLPGCFGAVWMGQPGRRESAPECRSCQIQTACLQKFAFRTLPDAAQTCFSHTPQPLAEYLSVSKRSVAWAQAFWHLMSGHVPSRALAEAEAARRSGGTALLPVVLPLPALRLVDARPPGGTELDSARRAPKKADREVRRRRRMAAAIRKDLLRARCKDGHTRFVEAALGRKPRQKPSLGRDDHEMCRVWDEKTYYSRWFRERQRSPLLAQLRPGVVLTRVYRGTTWTVKVHHGFYTVGDGKYPTLYSVTKAIVGAKRFLRPPRPDGTRPSGTRSMCNFSACKFFAKEIRKRLEGF